MFNFLEGKKEVAANGIAVINCGGVGFQLFVSDRTVGKIAAVKGDTVRLYTHLNVREDALELFGFYSPEEQQTFRLLLGVSGVGPRAALAVLSTLSPEQLVLCIIGNDAKAISAAPGVGLKTAQKIILELKDKVGKETISPHEVKEFFGKGAPSSNSAAEEAVSALVVLGYSRADAMAAVAAVSAGGGLSVEALIKQALNKLSRR